MPHICSMASLTMAAQVNVNAEDGGMKQVLELTSVHDLIVQKLKAEGVTDLIEFANLWTKDKY